MTKRNRAMELYRFIAAVMILCYHCHWIADREEGYLFAGCYLYVELFFILSGFLLMRGVRRETSQGPCPDPAGSTARYIKNRLARLYPHHLLSWILVAAIRFFLVKDLAPVQILQIGWPELMLVNIFGFVRGEYINIVCWYLSGLVFASLAVRYLLLKDENGFVKVIAPLLLVICYGTIFDRAGCLAVTIIFTKYAPHLGFMRSLADITVGVLAYRAYEWLEGTDHPLEGVVATVLEVGAALSGLVWTQGEQGKLDFLVVPLFFVFVISVFRGKSLWTRLFDNSVSEWLGRQSYAFFLNNLAVIYLFQYFFPEAGVLTMACACVPACLVLSALTGRFVYIPQ